MTPNWVHNALELANVPIDSVSQKKALQLNEDLAQVDVLILGAGPTGLGAATRLQQHGKKDWLIIDQASCPGCCV